MRSALTISTLFLLPLLLAPPVGSRTIAGGDLAAVILAKTLGEGESDEGAWDRESSRGGPLAPVMVGDGVLFRYRAPDARRVSLAGEFNGWDESATPLERGRNDVWQTVIELESGDWPYVFVVDGEWLTDPDNPVYFDGADQELEDFGVSSLLRIKRDDVVLPRPPGLHEGSFDFTMSYDRVNQVTLAGELGYENRIEMHPTLKVGGGYSFGRERWLYEVGISQPVFDPDWFEIGAAAYRRNATPDGHRIGDTENTIYALLFREDWRDYYEAEGISAHFRIFTGSFAHFTARWRDEDHDSVEKTTDWGVFGGDKRMRVNPPVDEGTFRSIAAAYELDTRNHDDHPTRGLFLRGAYEWAGDTFGGDYEFRKGAFDLRRYQKLSRSHYFDLRVMGGVIEDARHGSPEGTIEGFEAVPIQERFYLGGIGTMRATQFKSIVGDRMLLANAEVRVEIFHDFQVAVFADLGDAWIDQDDEFDLHTDAGVGFQDSDASFRINFAKKMDRGGDDVFISVRIRRMF